VPRCLTGPRRARLAAPGRPTEVLPGRSQLKECQPRYPQPRAARLRAAQPRDPRRRAAQSRPGRPMTGGPGPVRLTGPSGWTFARPTSCTSPGLSHGRSPAGPTLCARQTARCWRARRRPRARTPGMPSQLRGEPSGSGPARRPTTVARFCTGSPRCWKAGRHVTAAVDRWVWYAGWPDKVAQVAGAANAVAGPYFNFSVPEPTGVVAVIAPAESSLLGLVSVLAPVIATGNTAVVVASEPRPLPSMTLSEVLATSDVPAGVVNVLTGRTGELAPVLAGHMDVNAIDLSGIDPPARAEFERLAAANVKRVFAAAEDWAAPPGTRRMLAFLETKTVWHPVGI